MGSAVPNDLIGSCLLASVPAPTFKQSSAIGDSWFSEYNLAAWLGFRYQPQNTLSIVLRYEDSLGKHEVLVDQCSVPDGLQMMLSGRVQIHAVGSIKHMNVYCSGIEPGFVVRVDELFVQRVEETAALLRRAKIVSMG